MANRALAAAAIVSLAGCAGVQRKQLGHVDVTVLHPIINTQLFERVTFGVEDGRLFASAPYNATQFDMSLDSDGCLRGATRGGNIIGYCPDTPLPDAEGVRRWHGVARAGADSFTVALREGGRVLEVEAQNRRALIQLGEGKAEDEIRKHPELLGVAFARRFFPSAKNEPGSDFEHKEWKYVLTRAD